MGAPQYEQAGADVAGSGTTNTIPRWTGPSTLGDSGLIDNGTAIYTTARDRFGIGIATPDQGLHVLSPNNATTSGGQVTQQNFNGVSNQKWMTSVGGGDNVWVNGRGWFLRDMTAGATRLVCDTSGNVGIGTTSPNAALGIARAAGLDAYIETAGGGRVTGTSSVLYGQDSAGNGYVWNRANAGVFFGTNAQSRWQINTSGHFLAGADNSYDIGASGATRPRIVYVGTGVVGGYIRAGAASAGVASTTTIGNGTSTTATAGAQTLPANPLGFIIAHVGTTEVRIPYYDV